MNKQQKNTLVFAHRPLYTVQKKIINVYVDSVNDSSNYLGYVIETIDGDTKMFDAYSEHDDGAVLGTFEWDEIEEYFDDKAGELIRNRRKEIKRSKGKDIDR